MEQEEFFYFKKCILYVAVDSVVHINNCRVYTWYFVDITYPAENCQTISHGLGLS